MMEDPNNFIAQARCRGAEAAMAAASWLEMSESDARSILEDVDPAALDGYEPPNLSGEWADDPTPQSLYDDIVGRDLVPTYEALDALASAWEEGRDSVWVGALQVHALRVLDRTTATRRSHRESDARDLERMLEWEMERLRQEARSDR